MSNFTQNHTQDSLRGHLLAVQVFEFVIDPRSSLEWACTQGTHFKEETWVLLHMGLSLVRETNRVGHNVSWLGSKGEDIGRSMSPSKPGSSWGQYQRRSGTNPDYVWNVFGEYLWSTGSLLVLLCFCLS